MMPKGLFWRADYFGNNNEGGMFTAHIGLLNGLLKNGHNSVFAASAFMDVPEHTKLHIIEYSKLFRNFPELLFLPYNSRSRKCINDIILKEKIDYIYHYMAFSQYSPALIKKDSGLPLLVQSDGVLQWMKEYWGKSYFPKLIRWSEEIIWDAADAIFAVSDEIKKHMIEYGAESEKIHILPSGVDTSRFNPNIDTSIIKAKYELDGKFVIGFIGTFGRWHGVEYLARAVKEIVKRIPNALVFFVGDGDLRREVEEIARESNLDNHIILTGMQPYSMIPQFMAACDVLTSPGIHQANTPFFNSPVKLFEYMSMKKPVVATDVGQQGTVIADGVNGLLVRSETVEELAEKLYQVYTDADLAEKLAMNARKDAIEKHDWSVIAKTVTDVYDKLKSQK